MAKKLTSKKARQILHDKSVHGHPLTDKQRKFFGAVASGYIKAQGGEQVPSEQQWLTNKFYEGITYPPGMQYPGRIQDPQRRDQQMKDVFFSLMDQYKNPNMVEDAMRAQNWNYGSDRLENQKLQDYYGYDYNDIQPENLQSYYQDYMQEAFPLLEEQKNGGWLDKYENGGAESRMGGLTDIPFRYNGAWGGPSMQYGGNIQPPMAGADQTVPMYQGGGDIGTRPEDKGIREMMDWEKAYTNSPRFTQLSQKQGDSPEMTQRRRDVINKFDVDKDVIRIPEGVSYVDADEKGVPKFYLSPTTPEEVPFDIVNAHELGHLPYNDAEVSFPKGIYDEIQSRNFEFQKMKKTGKIDEDIKHDINPNEVRADKQGLLQELRQMGIYDAIKDGDITPEQWNKYKKSGRWHRLQRLYNDKDIQWLINNVAQNTPNLTSNFAEMGGSLPGAAGFMYARTHNPAPSEGPYAKKTMPSAQNGMTFYQHGLDWKPRNISQGGKEVKKYPWEISANNRNYSSDAGMMSRQLQADLNLDLIKQKQAAANLAAKQTYLSQGTPRTKESDERRYELNKQHALQTGSKFNYKTGDVARRNDKTAKGKDWGYVETPELVQTAAMATPSGRDYDAGAAAANVFVNMNPVTAPITSAGRLTQLAVGKDPYGFNSDGVVSNMLPALGILGDVAGVGSFKMLPGSKEVPKPMTGTLPPPQQSAIFGNVKQMFTNPKQYFTKPGKDIWVDVDDDVYKAWMEKIGYDFSNHIDQTMPIWKRVEGPRVLDWNKIGKTAAGVGIGSGLISGALNKKAKGGVVKDNMGYWNPENRGKVVEINSPDITMEGVYEPLIGISNTGDTKLMTPGNNYKFKGSKVREYPVKKSGGWLDKYE